MATKTIKQDQWQDVVIDTDTVSITVEWDHFCIIDKRDQYNGTRAIPKASASVRSAQRMRKWVLGAKATDLAGMSFWAVRDLLNGQGIAMHTFCSVD